MRYSGAGRKLIKEKNQQQKSCDTVPLKHRLSFIYFMRLDHIGDKKTLNSPIPVQFSWIFHEYSFRRLCERSGFSHRADLHILKHPIVSAQTLNKPFYTRNTVAIILEQRESKYKYIYINKISWVAHGAHGAHVVPRFLFIFHRANVYCTNVYCCYNVSSDLALSSTSPSANTAINTTPLCCFIFVCR